MVCIHGNTIPNYLWYQAVKELLRCAKAIKTLLIRKFVRKCKTLKEDTVNENKYTIAQEQLQLLKV